MNSKLLTAIDDVIGEPFNWNLLMFPPVLLLAPVGLLVWAFLSTERVTPTVSMSLLEAASEDERKELIAVLCRSKGRPTRLALSNLRGRLVRKTKAALEASHLAKVRQLCE